MALFDVDRTRPILPRSSSSSSSARVVVGAPPVLVATGAPGARDEVRAYAVRIAQAWDDFDTLDVSPWLDAMADGSKTVTPEASTLAKKIRADRTDFLAYQDKISGFDLLGPSPSEAWQVLQTHESALKKDREAFRALTGAIKSKDPGELERAGGVPTLESGALGSVPWVPIAWGVGLLGAGIALSSIAKIVRG